MTANTISIKSGTTKTLTVKKDSVINFVDLDKDLSKFSFKKSGKNLVIENNEAKIKLTVKDYFTSQNGAIVDSKLSAIRFKGENQVLLLSNDVKSRADYTTPYYDKTKNIYYGTMWDDTININDSDYSRPTFILGSGKDKIKTNTNGGNVYTGSGENEIHYWAVDSCDNRVYLADSGKTNLVLESTSWNKKISDIYATKDGSLHFRISNANYYIDKYLKTGENKNIEITVTEGTSSTNQKQNKYTLKSYLNNKVEDNILGLNYFGSSNSKKKQKITGNFLNNTLVGGKKADVIYCVGGENSVSGGLGNDKIYAGTGADTFNFNYGTGWGRDTIYNAGSTDTIKFIGSAVNDFDYIKKGNNLVINAYAYDYKTGKQKISDTVTLKDYFKSTDRDLTINSTKMHAITVWADLKGGTQNLGYGTYALSAKKGKKTTVVLNKSGNNQPSAVINFQGAGKEKFSGKYHHIVTYYDQGIVDRAKKGNDLVITYADGKFQDNLKTGKSKRLSFKKGSFTIKDYFKDGNVNLTNVKYSVNGVSGTYSFVDTDIWVHTTGHTKINESDKRYLYEGLKGTYKNWVTGSKKSDRIALTNTTKNIVDMGKGNDIVHVEINKNTKNQTTFCYSGGADNYIGGWGNDTYHVGATVNYAYYDGDKDDYGIKKTSFTKNSTLLINDKGGSDTINISAKTKDLRILFNVDSNGNIVTTATEAFLRSDGQKTDSLLIFNKGALTGKNLQKMIKNKGFSGAVEIDNYFITSGDVQGKIETINSNDVKGINMNNWINAVKGEVVKWLQANSKGSVAEVLNGTDKNAINSLINVFAGKTYQ